MVIMLSYRKLGKEGFRNDTPTKWWAVIPTLPSGCIIYTCLCVCVLTRCWVCRAPAPLPPDHRRHDDLLQLAAESARRTLGSAPSLFGIGIAEGCSFGPQFARFCLDTQAQCYVWAVVLGSGVRRSFDNVRSFDPARLSRELGLSTTISLSSCNYYSAQTHNRKTHRPNIPKRVYEVGTRIECFSRRPPSGTRAKAEIFSVLLKSCLKEDRTR